MSVAVLQSRVPSDRARLTPGGSVNIGRGIFGKERGMIRAQGDVNVTFLQNATVYAGGDINVGNQILNSRAPRERQSHR